MHKLMKGFLGIAALMATMAIPTTARAQTPHYDLLLKGGHVIDPANHLDAVMDVAVSKDKIVAVEKDIPLAQAGKVVNVSGLFVTPGLIDIHYHVGHGGAPQNSGLWTQSRTTSSIVTSRFLPLIGPRPFAMQNLQKSSKLRM